MRLKLTISYFLPAFIVLLTITACKKDKSEQIEHADPSTIIQDQYGRQLIFRGLCTSNDAKWRPGGMPWISEADVDREDKEFGFNFVRLLTAWHYVEPQQGEYDEAYLDRFAERVNWYTSRGMYVMIDMHQNVYGRCSQGRGAPDWACVTDGLEPFPPDLGLPWWVNNISPVSIAVWRNFFNYNRHPWLQDAFIQMWLKIVERFKDNPYVIGYDILNEPWPGDPIRAINGEFERKELAEFNQRVINAIREIDQEKYIFFQSLPAPVTIGFPSYLPKMEDPRASRRLVFAPHMYPFFLHEGEDYSPLDRRNMRDWERERRKDQRTQANGPLLCGEFGVYATSQGYDAFLTEATDMFDRHLWHWSYWSNDKGGGAFDIFNPDGSERPTLPYLIRTYPKATAGTVKSFSFDNQSMRFDMSFLSNPSIAQPTEIFIPKRHYPNGWNLKVEGTSDYEYEYDETRQQLNLTVKNAARVKVVIEAK